VFRACSPLTAASRVPRADETARGLSERELTEIRDPAGWSGAKALGFQVVSPGMS
jgi:hypothetical protein